MRPTTLATIALLTPAAHAAALPPPCAIGPADAAWVGAGAVRGGKGYVATPMGQVHYRIAGPAIGTTVLLLHQTPWSMNEFDAAQACLAALGVRSLAIDTPGYGMSDTPPAPPTIESYADNLVAVLDGLRIAKVVVVGHHTGAAIAASFAARHADRTIGALLHGVPLYTEKERTERLAWPDHPQTPKPDGSHLSDYYRYILAHAGTEPRGAISATWATLDYFLAGTGDVAHKIVFLHDMAPDLRAIERPVLILSDLEDSLHPMDLRAAALRPTFAYRQFSAGGPLALTNDPGRWATVIAEFTARVSPPPR